MPLLIFAAGLGIIGLTVGFYLVLQGGSNEVRARINEFIEAKPTSVSPSVDEGDTSLSRFRRRFNLIFAVLNSEERQRKLVAANWPITVSEFWFIRVGAALLLFLLSLVVFSNVLAGVALGMLAFLGPDLLLFRALQARQKLFQNQLIDSLTLIRGAVEAGYSFQQALGVVIQEMAAPTSDEFRQVRREVELGLPLSRALTNMASRMENDDFYLVVTVVNINNQVGGNLTNVLNVVIETIRDRFYLFSELRALTAYANFAGYLLTFLPVLTLAILAIMSPVYWKGLLEPGITRIIMIYAGCSVLVGNLVLRRMSKIQV